MEERINELVEWAEREVKIAIADITDEKEKDVYTAALSVYKNLLDNIKMNDEYEIFEPAKAVLSCLMYEDPLTPLTDNCEEDWELASEGDGSKIYQNKRRNTLFKKVSGIDGDKILYSDTDRAICVDMNSGKNYHHGFAYAILDAMRPITMPYSPHGKIRIFTDDFKYYKDCKDEYDTFAVAYFRYPNGEMDEIKRFFKMDNKINDFVEIDSTEYFARKKRYQERMKKNAN